MNENKRNHMLDFMKAIAAIGVVLVHYPFPGSFGKICASIGICGVILFFLISGYSAYDENDDRACQKISKRFKRNLIIFFTALAVYLIFTIIVKLISNNFLEWLNNFKDPWLYVRVFFLGDYEFMYADPIWYMTALIISYMIFYALHKLRIIKYAYLLLPILLILRVCMETYTNSYGADWHMSGNFLVGALPIMLLGHFMAKYKYYFLNIPNYATISFMLISCVLMFVTVNVKILDLDVSQVFKIWFASECFVFALKMPNKSPIKEVSWFGKNCSLYLYLIHFIVVVLIVGISPDENTWVEAWLNPLIVLMISILISILIYIIVYLIKNRRRKENEIQNI